MNLFNKSLFKMICCFLLLLSGNSCGQNKDVKIMLDWIVQGTHAPFFVAQDKGYFSKAGVNVSVEAGKGAGNTAVSVASGVYQFGWVDFPTLIKFNAEHPESKLIAVYISFDETPLSVVTLKSSNLNKPTDLNGKKIAGGPGTAVHDTFPILLKSAKTENVKVNWVAVQPQLFAPMLVRKEVDGMGGFINSQIPALLDLGIPLSDIHPIKYSDFGVDLYGLTLVTLKKYADENADVVKGVVAGLNKGTIDTLKDPQAALNILKKKDSMMKDSVEKVRLDIAIGLTSTKWVQKNGMSVSQPERMKKMIALIVDTYGLKKTQTPESEYSDKYLPPLSERQIN